MKITDRSARQPYTRRISRTRFTSQPFVVVWGRRFLFLIILIWSAGLIFGFTISLAILTAIGFVAAVIGLRYPAIGLLGVGILSTIDPLARVFLFTGGLLRWNTFNYWLLIVILLHLPFFLRLRDPHSRILQVFFILLILGLLISPSMFTGIQDILNIAAMFGLVVYFAKGCQEEYALYWLSIVCAVVAAVGGFIYYLQIDSLPYINPNAWALFPLTALFAIALGYKQIPENTHGKSILILLAVINFTWIFLSGSRGNMLIGICSLLFLFLSSRNINGRTLVFVILIMIGYWLSVQFVEQQAYSIGRIGKLVDSSYTLAERTSGRSDIAQAGWYLFQRNPFGVGTGGFRFIISNVDIFYQRELAAHSAWIKTLAENGVFGFLVLTAYVASFFFVGWHKRKQGLLWVGILISIAFTVGFLSTEFQGKSLWFLAAGGTVLLHKDEMSENIQTGNILGKRKGILPKRYRRVVQRQFHEDD